ncbi:MAG: hypothetical protein Q4A92_04820 [Corynebacterium sp.]|nr:hypothetical protein [Corynebacterium sp.]
MRLYATATLTAICVALFSACANPPGEIDSDRRINTAHDVSSPSSTKATKISATAKATAALTSDNTTSTGSATKTSTDSSTEASSDASSDAAKTTTASVSTTSTTEPSTTETTTTTFKISGSTTPFMVHTARGIPGVIDCVGTPTKRPDTLSLSCAHTGDKLKNITWETWNETSAKGTAIRETRMCGGTICKDKKESGQISETEVKVELSAPTMTSQGPAFTLITVNGASIVL